MKSCAICGPGWEPAWHYSRGTSFSRNFANPTDRTNYFLFGGCRHAEVFKASMTDLFVRDADRAAVEARWDARAVELFAQYTETWTDAQKTAYRARLWPQPPPFIPTELALE